MQVIESILADAAQIAALRRDIHAHPELCFEEQRTSDLIAEQLTSWGIPIHRGLGTTGIVAILKNGTSERAVGLRADMDALPITEHNTFAHRSTASRQDARVRPRRPHGDAARRRQASVEAPQLRRHRLPHLPARPKKAAAARAR